MRVADRFSHELELRQEIALGLLRNGAEVVEQLGEGHLLFVELPRRDLFLNRAAEELRLGHAVDREQALELLQFHGADSLAGLERADGLLSDGGEPRDVLLTQT